MRPLCGKKHGGNRKSQGALARLCEFPGRFRIYRAQRSQQGCSLSLGMLRLAEPPTGRARLRSSLKSPRNPITPIKTSRVATLHPGLYKRLREDARRVIGATAKPLYPIDGKAAGFDRRNPKTSLFEGGGPPQRWKEFVPRRGAHCAPVRPRRYNNNPSKGRAKGLRGDRKALRLIRRQGRRP